LIRWKVFVEEQAVPPWEEIDEFDEDAEHFAVAVDDVPVGTARIVDKGGGVGKIGRVAVLSEHRGNGFGQALMEHVIDRGFQRFHTLILDAQMQVIPFYERLGFTAEGEIFLDCDIEHRLMRATR